MHARLLAAAWPAPHDPASAERLIERMAEAGGAAERLAHSPPSRALLATLGGHSPFLSDLAVREAEALASLLDHGPETALAEALTRLRAVAPESPRAQIASALRGAKRIVALTAAVADIGGIWDLEHVTGALSDLAEATLDLAVAHLLRAAHEAGELRLPEPTDPGRDSGLIVLGMGKFGARELNYSSDIDLILIYDPAARIYTSRTDGDARQSFMSRLARGLVSLMEVRDAEGYVFRTDLRLRPDPSITPPAVSLPAAISYYESMGQNWERAAMIKARPVAGDRVAGAAFLEAIRPFVWRRGLDFAAVADIHAMKRRIDTHKGRARARETDPLTRIAGHNLKLGQGGIREIEFLAQTLQLVWGGRDPGLRTAATLGSLHLLAQAGLLSFAAADELADAYRFLRRVEHRLQMVADRQTHSLPERAGDLTNLASFLGYADLAAFAAALIAHLDRVRRRYTEVFDSVATAPGDGEDDDELDFRGDDPSPPETVAALHALGFTEAERIVAAVRGWQAGRVRALRSGRARDLLQTVLPKMLAALARQPHPDAAFRRFDEFLSRLPAGVQILSLVQRNPGLLERIAAILGAAPSLSDHLTLYPSALEGLITPETPAEPAALLASRLRDARRLEDTIGIVRRTVREEDFAIAVATLEGRIDVDEAGLERSALADAALGALLPAVLDDFAQRYGRVPGGEMAVVVLGKAGGREMMAGSDLDLMLIYDHPEAASDSTGSARSLPAPQWFVRACHAFVAALTTPGADGHLYAVDMRLRPSGNKGPVAVSLSAFRRYHAESAWTWERMALTRARVAAGSPGLRARTQAAIAAALDTGGPPERVLGDAASMRARMVRELPSDGPWDVKLRAGGLVEAEFIAQALQLAYPQARDPSDTATRAGLFRLQAIGVLTREEAGALIAADKLFRTVQGMLRITLGRALPDTLPGASLRPLLRATGAVDLPALRTSLDAAAQQVRGAFVRHLGEIRE